MMNKSTKDTQIKATEHPSTYSSHKIPISPLTFESRHSVIVDVKTTDTKGQHTSKAAQPTTTDTKGQHTSKAAQPTTTDTKGQHTSKASQPTTTDTKGQHTSKASQPTTTDTKGQHTSKAAQPTSTSYPPSQGKHVFRGFLV